MSTNPPAREPASPDARQGMCVPAVLFGIVVVFLAQEILGQVNYEIGRASCRERV